jgi:hypothetical protein
MRRAQGIPQVFQAALQQLLHRKCLCIGHGHAPSL